MTSELRQSGIRRWILGCVLGLVALATACGPSAAYRQGTGYAQSGDWVNAVRSFRVALAEDPDDEDVRAQLAMAEESLVASTASAVGTYLGFHDFSNALHAIAPALELMPQDPRLLASLESIRVTGVAYHRGLLEQGQHRASYEGASQLAASFPHDPEIDAVLRDSQLAYADDLRDRALRAEIENRLGDALAWWTALWHLNRSEEAVNRAGPLRLAIEEEVRFTYHLTLDGDWPIGVMVQVQDGLAELVLDDKDAQAALVASLSPPELVESYYSSIAAQSYLAGYEDVENPAYHSAEHDVARQENRVLDAEREVLRRESEVHDAEVRRNDHEGEDDYQSYYDAWDRAMRDLQTSRERLFDEREQLQRYREQLRDTPYTVRRDVWAEHRYEVETWTLEGFAELSARIFRDDTLVAEIRDTLSAATTDTTHEAQPILRLPDDPLIYPLEPIDLAVAIQDQALARLNVMLQEHFQGYRHGFESNGLGMMRTAPEEAAEFLVRYILLQPSSVSPEVVAWLQQNYGISNLGLAVTIEY